MSTKPINDGGPAFPVPGVYSPDHGFLAGVPGLSLRDWFAGQALAGLLAGAFRDTCRENCGEVPREAYLIADAMLAAREKAEG